MRVAIYHANDDLRIEERPAPPIGPGELLLRVHASGICGSDVMEWYRKPSAPVVLGHEVAGVIERVGQGVTRFVEGQRVVATHHVPCMSCRYCDSDRHSVCPMLKQTSFDPGGFAELLRLTTLHVEHGVFPLPDDVDFDSGSFMEPLACVVRGQRHAGVRRGDDVAVIGAGLSGLLHVALARVTGASRIVAAEPHAVRREAARDAGAVLAVEPSDSVVDVLREANGGCGFTRVLVCTSARSAVEQALRLVDDGGSVLLFAPLDPRETLTVDQNMLWRRCVSIVHSYAGPPAEMREALALIASQRVDVDALISHRLGLDAIGEGFRLTVAAAESLKVVIRPQE